MRILYAVYIIAGGSCSRIYMLFDAIFSLSVRAVEWECGMWRRMLDTSHAGWSWPDDLSAAFSQRAPRDAEEWPTSAELFLESGIVLVTALGTCAAVDVLLTVLGIPDVY